VVVLHKRDFWAGLGFVTRCLPRIKKGMQMEAQSPNAKRIFEKVLALFLTGLPSMTRFGHVTCCRDTASKSHTCGKNRIKD